MVAPSHGLVRPNGSISNQERGLLRAVLLSLLVVCALAFLAYTSSSDNKNARTSLVGEDQPYGVATYAQPPASPQYYAAPPAQPAAVGMAETEGEEAPVAPAPAPAYAAIPTAENDAPGAASGAAAATTAPTSAAEGLDDTVEDYDKLKSERRQAMDFCDAHFSSWINIQKCISELFKNARYR